MTRMKTAFWLLPQNGRRGLLRRHRPVTALVRKNAPSYVRLDVDIKSDRPDLLPTEVVKQALFDYMEWAESVDPGAWAMLASDHYGRMVEPNYLQRSLDILETMGTSKLQRPAGRPEA